MTSLGYSILFASLQTLVATMAPVGAVFSVFSAMDVLQNTVSVAVPFYRTVLFAKLTSGRNHTLSTSDVSSVDGDPDPRCWLMSCTVHGFFAAAALGPLLLFDERRWHSDKDPKPMKTS